MLPLHLSVLAFIFAATIQSHAQSESPIAGTFIDGGNTQVSAMMVRLSLGDGVLYVLIEPVDVPRK
jgi:hypothetical protein